MEKSKEHIVHVGCDRGLCHQAVGRQDKQLNTYDWLADVPGNPYTTDLVEVQFKHTRKGYYHNVNNLDLKKGDIVAVEASPGHDIGVVTLTGRLVKLQLKKVNIKSPDDIKRIYRIARENDIQKWHEAQAREHSTMIESRKIAKGLGLDMKIGDVEYQGDGNKAIFYYIADERVDFRQLIKDLAVAFHVRIEMKQIGARQEAGRIGGTGPCGRELCCATWMKNFSSVDTDIDNFAAIKHIILHTIYFLMPALMKVPVIPFPQGMVMGTQVCVDVIHHLALTFNVIFQILILNKPVLYAVS